jgi:hypothetical protein
MDCVFTGFDCKKVSKIGLLAAHVGQDEFVPSSNSTFRVICE